jgi:hypothetical protein
MMSRILITLLLLAANLVAVNEAGAQTKRKHRKPRLRTVVRYVWQPEKGSLFYKLTRELPQISKIEISHIQSALHPGPLRSDEILFHGKEPVRILATTTLLNRDTQGVTKFWRRLNQASGDLCFAPAYMLKFYSDDRELFETIVCFGCQNLMLPDGELWGFDAHGIAGVSLLKELNSLFPQSPNKSLDRSGGSVFRNIIGAAKVG